MTKACRSIGNPPSFILWIFLVSDNASLPDILKAWHTEWMLVNVQNIWIGSLCNEFFHLCHLKIKRKWVCGFPWTTSIQARSTVWGAGAGSPPFAPPTSNLQSNHPFKQDNSVHSLCIIGTYLLESGQAILVPREALWASQLEAWH